MGEEIIETYDKSEDISAHVEKLKAFSFNSLIKGKHFYYSLAEKNTDLELIKKVFNEFFRVSLVQKRKHKNGKISYDFYYALDDESYILYAVSIDERILINAFHVNRNFEHFKKRLIKAYGRKLI
jgi:hypothetical protein